MASGGNKPNAHIEAWLAEWRDEARQKGHQSQHTFAKAIVSLRAYPLPIKSGSEASILKNFGPALCQMIDKRLKQEKNTPSFQSQPVADSWDEQIPAASSRPPAKKTASKSAKHTVQEANRDFDVSDDGEEMSPQTSPKKRARTTKPKEYIPAYRSGGFALLIALLEHSQDPSATRNYMLKTELIEAAQPNSDTSFKPQARGGMPTGPNAFFYTAWSSMSTLIKKLLVVKVGNPAKFSLTEQGQQLAERLQAGMVDNQNNESSNGAASSQPVNKPTVAAKLPAPKKGTSSSSASARILSTYVKDDDSSEDERRPAASSSQKILPPPRPTASSTKTTTTISSSQPVPAMIRTASTSSTVSFVPKMARTASTSSSTASRQPLLADSALIDDVYKLLSSNADFSGQFPWEVVLCVDNQEYYGTASKKNLIADLLKLGVRAEVRRLSVGDYLWVLRRHPGTSAAGSSGEDIVLDYVMERKRIDDLVSSLIDGRFKEQKARMKNSGRPKTIYLVEEFTAWSASTAGWRLSVNPSTLLQTVINTLIIDEFELRMTRDGHHTAVMLACLTRQIEVAVGKVAAKCRSGFAFSTEEKSDYLTRPVSAPARFGEWNAASSKRRPMTVREVFARQLMCVQGVSADRAIAITSLYPTPAAFIEACSLNESEVEKTLATFKIGTRKLGPAVSKKLVSFYTRFA